MAADLDFSNLNLDEVIDLAVQNIESDEEKSRRAYALRRQKIFRDGGREFLIESLKTEFDVDSVNEFRLCPFNFLKKIVQKKSQIYKIPPIRTSTTGIGSDQDLVDFYSQELAFDVQMKKANEYFNLHSNTALYIYPQQDFLRMKIVPPHLYSIVPDPIDRTKVLVWIFNNFAQEHEVISRDDLQAATGLEGFSRDRRTSGRDIIATQSRETDDKRRFIIWSPLSHVTINSKGAIISLDAEKGEEQFINPIGRSPIIHLQKDTDNEAWAEQGEDAADIALLLQRMWTDLATIIKHQGYGQMVVVSEEAPKRVTQGITKILWLRKFEGKEAPSVSFISADSRISEIKETLRDMLFLLLTTNDINPSAVGRADGGSAFNSGIQALLEMSEAIEAMRSDQPTFRDSEKESWALIKDWHNYMFDIGVLRDDAKRMGKFSDDFDVNVTFAEMKPLETERDRLELIEKGRDLKLLTKREALKKLHPNKTDDEIDQKMVELEEELQAFRQKFGIEPQREIIRERVVRDGENQL